MSSKGFLVMTTALVGLALLVAVLRYDGLLVGQRGDTPAILDQSASDGRRPAQIAPAAGRYGQVDTAVDRANQTIFLIVMENANWSRIEGSDSAPYINETLLPIASYARQYYNPPRLHPSEPNYLWLEAGTSFGVADDGRPSVNHQGTSMHLVSLLERAGIAWKSYQEGISGTECPLRPTGLYTPRHNPMVYFDDVTGGNDPASDYCIAHIRPYKELASDLRSNTVARYNFITPNLCDDMHNTTCGDPDRVANGDRWLAREVPVILDSQAYAHGGVLIVTWDEGEQRSDGPIGLIVVSPNAKGRGYSNSIHYTHSSTLRTIQTIFGVMPLLGDAASATDLRDLFAVYP